MKGLLYIALSFFFLVKSNAQCMATDSVGGTSLSGNVYNKVFFSDSLCSSFCIVIKKEVKPHYHRFHSEHVVVLDGEGSMKLNGKIILMRKGDVVFIPKNAIHSVKSTGVVPLKVLSIQAPRFDGNDRIFVEE